MNIRENVFRTSPYPGGRSTLSSNPLPSPFPFLPLSYHEFWGKPSQRILGKRGHDSVQEFSTVVSYLPLTLTTHPYKCVYTITHNIYIYIYIYIYVGTYTHTHTHTHIHMYKYIPTDICTHLYTDIYIFLMYNNKSYYMVHYIHIHMFVHTRIYRYTLDYDNRFCRTATMTTVSELSTRYVRTNTLRSYTVWLIPPQYNLVDSVIVWIDCRNPVSVVTVCLPTLARGSDAVGTVVRKKGSSYIEVCTYTLNIHGLELHTPQYIHTDTLSYIHMTCVTHTISVYAPINIHTCSTSRSLICTYYIDDVILHTGSHTGTHTHTYTHKHRHR